MRSLVTCLCLGMVLLATGCNHTRWRLFNPTPAPETQPVTGEVPTTDALVQYLNKNSERLQTLRCDDMVLTYSERFKPSISLEGRMVAQKPRNFRMTAMLLRKPEVDLGSNDQEFWYWIRRGPRAQIYCKYDDLEKRQNIQLPLPFQPQWILETLGMSDYGPATRYQLVDTPTQLKLVERTTSPQGKAIKKVIVFNRRRVTAPTPQVTDHILIDEQTGKEICSAHIHSAQIDPTNGALIPKKVDINWPEDNIVLTMRLTNASANVNIPANFPAFTRNKLEGIPAFNLATRQFDSRPTSIRRVRGLR